MDNTSMRMDGCLVTYQQSPPPLDMNGGTLPIRHLVGMTDCRGPCLWRQGVHAHTQSCCCGKLFS